jgi:hypothetical protein
LSSAARPAFSPSALPHSKAAPVLPVSDGVAQLAFDRHRQQRRDTLGQRRDAEIRDQQQRHRGR